MHIRHSIFQQHALLWPQAALRTSYCCVLWNHHGAIRAPATQGAKSRVTVCVSSQVGCAMGCKFCYTGRMGLLQNLSAAQIVEQLVHARRHLAQEGLPETATNIVFMGMGASSSLSFRDQVHTCV